MSLSERLSHFVNGEGLDEYQLRASDFIPLIGLYQYDTRNRETFNSMKKVTHRELLPNVPMNAYGDLSNLQRGTSFRKTALALWNVTSLITAGVGSAIGGFYYLLDVLDK